MSFTVRRSWIVLLLFSITLLIASRYDLDNLDIYKMVAALSFWGFVFYLCIKLIIAEIKLMVYSLSYVFRKLVSIFVHGKNNTDGIEYSTSSYSDGVNIKPDMRPNSRMHNNLAWERNWIERHPGVEQASHGESTVDANQMHDLSITLMEIGVGVTEACTRLESIGPCVLQEDEAKLFRSSDWSVD